jgi:DNA-directed RNA polymerase subunit RPC12/RpoP
MSLTGRSRLESQEAAFTRCERCSKLILMSLRFRMPRTVGMRPTAV